MSSRQHPSRPDPEALLRQVQAQEREEQRGTLKIFLGYASGVGKSHRMLDEGRRRRQRGQDVVVGAIQPRLSPEAQDMLNHLEVVPLQQDNGLPKMDVDSILRRHPGVCIIDGLAYDNPRGSRHAHRWQDVEEILCAGISVITSLNLQYIEERRAQVEQITGKVVESTVPISFIHEANEIEIVDAPAETHGGAESGVQASGPSQQQKMQALREIALLLAADVVDRQLESYLHSHGLNSQWGTQERILVGVTSRSDATQMLQSGARNAKRLHGELLVVCVRQPDLGEADQKTLDQNLNVAKEAGASIHVLEGDDPIEAIVEFAKTHGVTQMFIGHSQRQGWTNRWFGDPVDRLIRCAKGIDIQVFPHGWTRTE